MEYITSLSNGAQDIVRGLAGQETGAAVTLAFEIHEEGPIGCAVNDAGQVTSVDAGSPAEKHGVRMGDLITHLNDEAVDPASAGAGLTGTAARPLRATAFRREPRDYDDFGVGVVKFRVDEEIVKCERILQLMLDSPQTGPPPSVLRHAHGLVFLRCFETALGSTSSRFGTGAVVARLPDGTFSAPSAVGVLGFGMGWQIGVQVMDLLIVLNRPSAVKAFTAGFGVTLGAALGCAAGPYGVGGETRIELNSEAVAPCYSYSITRGVFAGISLEGATLNERSTVNAFHYLKPCTAKQLLSGEVPATPAAAKLHAQLRALDGADPPQWRVGAWAACDTPADDAAADAADAEAKGAVAAAERAKAAGNPEAAATPEETPAATPAD